MSPPRTLLLLALWLLLHQAAPGEGCQSGLFTKAGDCCTTCPPGSGVLFPCGDSDTECEPCRANATFSDIHSATDKCQPCSSCQGATQSVQSACTSKRDTACRCPDGNYLHLESGACLPCQLCPKGSGAKAACTRTENTKCEECPRGFYSEVKSSVSPCLTCRSQCNEKEVEIGECTAHHDLLCMDKDVPILKRTDKDENSTLSGSPHFVPPEDNSKNIIPVYCSVLAAVVIGLIGYVAFKCWSSCKQKKLLTKTRAGEMATSGEGEKLHSDSGVFLDTHSLQEQNQLNKAKLEPKLYINLPPHKQEEVESLLADTSRGKDWQRLANLLGYEEEAIDTFSRGEDPVHTLLTDWSSKDSSTLEVLCAALVNMERADVVETLNSTTDASSVV
ncbi:tumor necrosis factor receptor superfamily member 16-like isoform X2 [Pseudophryne corroboree]|uniref:tumor necrosis factor receptor superfamily member 16-like isoform X2 n=1 Tax=Pseudophryne corroboree TaxID=495146 RepID=UPI00308189DD